MALKVKQTKTELKPSEFCKRKLYLADAPLSVQPTLSHLTEQLRETCTVCFSTTWQS